MKQLPSFEQYGLPATMLFLMLPASNTAASTLWINLFSRDVSNLVSDEYAENLSTQFRNDICFLHAGRDGANIVARIIPILLPAVVVNNSGGTIDDNESEK